MGTAIILGTGTMNSVNAQYKAAIDSVDSNTLLNNIVVIKKKSDRALKGVRSSSVLGLLYHSSFNPHPILPGGIVRHSAPRERELAYVRWLTYSIRWEAKEPGFRPGLSHMTALTVSYKTAAPIPFPSHIEN